MLVNKSDTLINTYKPMKWKSFILIVLCFSLLINQGCKENPSKDDILKKVLLNIEQIKSAAYFSTISASAPGDTLMFNSYDWYNKEFINPADTFIGSTFAWFQARDTSKLYYSYDGLAQVYIFPGTKTIEIDSFKTSTLPFRPIGPPFFNYTKSIIKYALETKDSISTSLKNQGDSLLFTLIIHSNKQVEFFGKPLYIDNPYATGKEVSRYDIWISKSDYLPYQYRRKMSANTSWETCRNVKLNNSRVEDFIPSKYFPSDFAVAVRGKNSPTKIDLTGKTAPDFTLNDFNGNVVAIKGLKSKVIILQFTGIGCGPCHASIPFLKKLVADNKSKSFELISIETWSKNIDGIKRYFQNNNLNYKFLVSSDEVTKDYQVNGVPSFYVLDENRVIRRIIHGYEKGTTDKEIEDVVHDLIK
jgi:thiol-disulfide isomerase/thioredoxin